MKNNILVLGCNGMAGHLISLYLKEKGYKVTGFARENFDLLDLTIIGDVTDFDFLNKVILNGDYDVVINCVGLLNQYADNNKPEAILINSYLPHYLSKITSNTKSRIIHMSTDCVFAGNSGPYYEESIPDGKSIYDRTKALGEINNSKDLTFRNSIIGPDMKSNGIGLFNWFMSQKGPIKGYTYAIWTGVTTLTLAKAMEQAIKDDLSGLYNLVNNSSISKYNLLVLFNKVFRNSEINIIPNGDIVLDKSLRCSRKDFSFIVPNYEEQIIELSEWIHNHKNLYPHYNI